MKLKKPISIITVNDIFKCVASSQLFLPSFQRDFSWKNNASKLELLFDSIYQGYPISDILLLNVAPEDEELFSFFDIKKTLAKDTPFGNQVKNFVSNEEQYCIMDGQQRITSLYLGFFGELRYKKTDDENSILCFNLLHNKSNIDEEDVDVKQTSSKSTMFQFRKISDYDIFEDKLWISLKEIYPLIKNIDTYKNIDDKIIEKIIEKAKDKYKKEDAQSLLFKNGKLKKRGKYSKTYPIMLANIEKNHKTIKDNIIRFYRSIFEKKNIICNIFEIDKKLSNEEKSKNLYEIFLRLNSGGQPLTPAELLYSKIDITIGKTYDVRKNFSDYLIDLNEYDQNNKPKYSFDINFLMRCFWYIFGKTSFKAFMMSNISTYCTEANFNKIISAIKDAKKAFEYAGFEARNIPYNMLIPITYYSYHGGVFNDKTCREISKYFNVSLAIGYFGGSSDSVLMKIRQVLQNEKGEIELFKNKEFDYELFKQQLQLKTNNGRGRKFTIDANNIETMLEKNYKDDYNGVRNILFLIFKWVNIDDNSVKYDADHIHPKTFAENVEKCKNVVGEKFNDDEYAFFRDNVNKLANMQILDKMTNTVDKNATPLREWYNKSNKKEALKKLLEQNYIYFNNDEELELYNFKKFYLKRRGLLKQALCDIFGIKNENQNIT